MLVLALGVKRHSVALRRGPGPDGEVCATVLARGPLGSWRAARALRDRAAAGEFRRYG